MRGLYAAGCEASNTAEILNWHLRIAAQEFFQADFFHSKGILIYSIANLALIINFRITNAE